MLRDGGSRATHTSGLVRRKGDRRRSGEKRCITIVLARQNQGYGRVETKRGCNAQQLELQASLGVGRMTETV